EPGEPWTKDVSDLAPDAKSDDIIAALDALGGWGTGSMQITFGISFMNADSGAPRQTVTGSPDGYCYGGPDCDPVPLEMPLPPGGNAEDSEDYFCDTAN